MNDRKLIGQAVAPPDGASDASPESTFALAHTRRVRAADDRGLMHFPINHLVLRPPAPAVSIVEIARTGEQRSERRHGDDHDDNSQPNAHDTVLRGFDH
jgi:hypothetical protein